MMKKTLNFITKSFFALLIVLLSINVLYGFYHYYVHFNYSVFIIIPTVTILFLLFVIAIKQKLILKLNDKQFFLTIILFTLSISLTTFLLPFIGFKDDIERYHNATLKILNNISSFSPNDIIQKRTLFYFIPIYFISSNIIFLKLMNITINVLTTIILHKTLKTNFKSILSFRVFFILFSIIPLRYTHINYLSHDLVALFLLSLLFYCISLLLNDNMKNNYFKNVLLILISGFLILVLDFQRSLGLILVLSLLITIFYLFFIAKQEVLYLSVFKIGSVIFMFLLFNFLVSITINTKKDNTPSAVSNTAMLFSYNTLGSNGTYVSGAELRNKYFTLIENNYEALKYSIANYLSQIYYHPKDYLKLIIKKNVVLTSYRAFHFLKDKDNSKLKLIVKNSNYANNFYRSIINIFCVLGLVMFFLSPIKYNSLFLFITIFSLITILLLLFVSEVAGSYMFINFIFLNFLATKGVIFISKRKLNSYNTTKNLKKIVSPFLLLLISIFVLFLFLKVSWNLIPFKTISLTDLDIKKSNMKIIPGKEK